MMAGVGFGMIITKAFDYIIYIVQVSAKLELCLSKQLLFSSIMDLKVLSFPY